MFDSFKGMASMAGLMKDLPRLKAKMEEVKTQLKGITVEAETGGGAVHATANAQMELVSLKIDQAMLGGLVDASDPADRVMAEDLIVGAVNAALAKAREAAQETISAAGAELGFPIPPGGLSGLM